MVGEAEESRGSGAGLHVFEGDVVVVDAFGIGVADVFQRLAGHGVDTDFVCSHAQRRHQIVGSGFGAG